MTLAEIRMQSDETAAKYRDAISQTLSKMQENL
jgi:hypothetical protein